MSSSADYEALLQFLYMAPVGLVQASTDGEIALINPISAQLLMPLSPDGDLSNLFDTLHPVAPDLRHRAMQFEPLHGMVCEALCVQVDAGVRGSRDPRYMSITLLKLDADRLMAVLTDISQQVKREKLLRQNEAWLKAIFTGVSDYALMRLDAAGRVVDWNPSIGRVTGHSRTQVQDTPYSVFYPPDATTPERVLDRLREADDNGWSLDDGWRLRADGSRFWGSAMIAPLPNDEAGPAEGCVASAEEAPGYCLVIRDISDKREATETLRRATNCDYLTGLANRRTFFEAAEVEFDRWQRSPRPLSLVLLDADHFKSINDTYGHPAGDAVLRRIAAVLEESFRTVDLVARIGGEEFAVLLPSTDQAGALTVADRLRERVAALTLDVDGHAIRCTVSGGVAVMEEGVAGLDALLKRADDALYLAKRRGRNRIEPWRENVAEPAPT